MTNDIGMRNVKIKSVRRDYLKYSIGVALSDLMEETVEFKISTDDNQIRLILIGTDNTILVNFHDHEIKWFKCYTEINVNEKDRLFVKVGEIINKSVLDDV